MLQNHGVNVFKHYSDTFLETIAEFYDFSVFSLFLSFDHVFSCITITIEIENTPFLLHLIKMSSKPTPGNKSLISVNLGK